LSPEWLQIGTGGTDQGHVTSLPSSLRPHRGRPGALPETKAGTQAISALHRTLHCGRLAVLWPSCRSVVCRRSMGCVLSPCTNPGCASHRTLHTLLYAHCFLPAISVSYARPGDEVWSTIIAGVRVRCEQAHLLATLRSCSTRLDPQVQFCITREPQTASSVTCRRPWVRSKLCYEPVCR
jgi:hypothetical protein